MAASRWCPHRPVGLTAGEAGALFLIAVPISAATPDVRAALRKLVRALPEPFRAEAEAAASSRLVDPQQWGSPDIRQPPPRFLEGLQDAVIRGVQVRLGYVDRAGVETERTIHPLGILAKGRSWYLIVHPRPAGEPSGSTGSRPSTRPTNPSTGPRTSTSPRAGETSLAKWTAGARPSRSTGPVHPTGSICFEPPWARTSRSEEPPPMDASPW